MNGILSKHQHKDLLNETGGTHIIKAIDTVAHRAQGDGVECKAGKVFGGVDGVLWAIAMREAVLDWIKF